MTQGSEAAETLKRTPLYDLHVELGAKMVPFAGYEMPVQYPLGVLKEHLHTRSKAGLFDVSHMGQAFVQGPDHATTAAALEALVPGEIAKLGLGRQRYTMLLNATGGILDDLMVTRSVSEADDGRLMLVVNAACKDADYAHMNAHLDGNVTLEPVEDRALVALQGPTAAAVMAKWCPQAADMGFMTASSAEFDGIDCHISRSGYTGEDGYEISIAADKVEQLARTLLSHDDVEAIGLGARDSLRLEAGLCLYGHDIDETTSPVEADLVWSMSKRRREEGGFPGADRIQGELRDGPSRLRVGIKPDGRAPAREGAEIVDGDGKTIGSITSGGFGPSAEGPVAMGYVESVHATPGSQIGLMVRGEARPARVVELPFVPHRYYRKSK
ncbi:MAG: glycine cleavage system aminomethyltransferase GcvT [Hyphomicrobiaceae bacterium]|nr:glycine cleavage system aminomethyltransferase GcvT [Hyphomicrobiaceae bacterium]